MKNREKTIKTIEEGKFIFHIGQLLHGSYYYYYAKNVFFSLNSRYDKPQKLALDENAVGVTAGLASTIIWTEEGSAYAFGCDTTGQLGLGIKEDDDEKAGFFF